MVEQVVVPLDGSPHALGALGPARSLAVLTGADVLLVSNPMTDDEDRRDEFADLLARCAADLELDRVATRLADDESPAASILAAAETDGAVVCMSTHGRTGLGHATLGSVAEAVVRGSAGPVLLVGPRVEPGGGDLADGDLVLTVDGSEASEAAVPVAAEWARALDLRVRVVVVGPAPVGLLAEHRGSTTEHDVVRRIAERLRADGAAAVEEVLRDPNAADAVLELAHRVPAKLIVMASHGRTGPARVVLGSVAMRVVHRSPCPVLVIGSTASRG
jgi:nucleotide-binding universal stress UspA family protein